MKGWVDLGATQWFWTQDPLIRNPAMQSIYFWQRFPMTQLENVHIMLTGTITEKNEM